MNSVSRLPSPTSAATATLPLEILDRIFSFLERNIVSLKACSEALSSSGRSNLVDRWLYRHVSVYAGNMEMGVKGTIKMTAFDLLKLLTSGQPIFRRYTHTLCIALQMSINSVLFEEDLGCLLRPSLLPSLRGLALIKSASGFLKWEHWPVHFQRAFLD
ncbi:hypothetical protein CPB83DRAFT_511529 [Crepidotus variabilis]|uniref:F-box domain-containing protein n=1 Tax=Crepidotus variabilis TaxID=179855 RepID=A0A9P6JM83_9AGAR|nr:hypothetical protein CPB83DRAFT_511529 [Crepidotus variabilis]